MEVHGLNHLCETIGDMGHFPSYLQEEVGEICDSELSAGNDKLDRREGGVVARSFGRGSFAVRWSGANGSHRGKRGFIVDGVRGDRDLVVGFLTGHGRWGYCGRRLRKLWGVVLALKRSSFLCV